MIQKGFISAYTTAIACLILCSPSRAQDIEFGGSVSAEVRYFSNGPQFVGQFETFQPSIALSPEIRWKSANGGSQVVASPFFRADSQDSARTHADLREAYYRFRSDEDWTLTIGAAHVFWGKTESRHLVDVVNQVDGVEDIDEEDRLGQPMVNLALNKAWGQLDLYFMSGFRLRTFPGRRGRLRLELPVDNDAPVFNRSGNRAAPDFAARYAHHVGPVDLGISIFHGTSREPRFLIEPAQGRLRPVYDLMTQGGLEAQYTTGAWLWKAEAIVRKTNDQTFFASVSGFEYTLFGVASSGLDLGFIGEYQHDGRDETIIVSNLGMITPTPVTPFGNAFFAGARLAFNDMKESTLLIGATTDVGDGSTLAIAEFQRRIKTDWHVELEARIFTGVDPSNLLDSLRSDDFVSFKLTRHF